MNNIKINPSLIQSIENTKSNSNKVDNGFSFADALKQELEELNKEQIVSDKAMADVATGNVKDLHQAAIAINKAETSMKFMLEVRNKAINAYKEISRTQI
ncbi:MULTISPECIES: flagellar hook-basal body complex protein FliE [unclassified Campylobacter]|uniref:flagellar hook-basal body complex protein FliE n=1 Tax=unclassified Campylobacter TaxID=2593542 RepID=UPI001BDAEA55|nr:MULTISPECIES: flagellar hook-basal body complex protein FliE [unclassified Campylobacter]MBZ7976496.1 flagellar hook-basal body complex protein FliE [Campylobacter sp. RM12637]MBZ7978079.1 flagellar hook-basal body complex protein FliE [Campylobacter sp. RM12654]MBZ7979974.1 flagellar hook-basal body complex protein FliE [Campylobacter sp. RM12642]MBZ7981376.1 flagellar hook-basal body complex protein FliE [Campylobacter sp. RM12640]MBZ7989028.1 flagellar hook-basal body complex protein Fli